MSSTHRKYILGLLALLATPWLAAADPAAGPAPVAAQAGHAAPGAQVTPANSAGRPGGFADSVQPLLQKYCYECHGPTKQKAQVRYDQLSSYRTEERHLWAKVHEKLAEGEMPPEDHPQPTDAEKK